MKNPNEKSVSKNCECCFMPLANDKSRTSEKYCSYCFKDNKLLADEMTLSEFQKVSYDGMRQAGFWLITAWFFSFLIRFAPYWRSRANSKENKKKT